MRSNRSRAAMGLAMLYALALSTAIADEPITPAGGATAAAPATAESAEASAPRVWAKPADDAPLRQMFIDGSDLKDPFSVQFRKLQTSTRPNRQGVDVTSWCGEVNAKNAMGAYVGWSPFIAFPGTDGKPVFVIASGDHLARHRAELVKIACKGSEVAPS